MLVRLGVLLCAIYLQIVCASALKIQEIIPFGTSSVRIDFNQEIKRFKEVGLKGFRSYLEVEAILVIPKKRYQFSNHSTITIAQNTPKFVRVVLDYNAKTTYQTKIVGNKLYVSIIPKQISQKTARQPIIQANSKKSLNKTNYAKSTQKSHVVAKKEVAKKEVAKKEVAKKEVAKKEVAKKEVAKKEVQNDNNNQQQEFIGKETHTLLNAKHSKKTKKIVLDAGHGGKDCGAMSANLVCEKDIVLEVVKFLSKELKKRGYSILLTRDKDVYIDLVGRTEFANKKGANLFISVHANSIPKHSTSKAHGIETYFLSTARSERARKVAEQENQDDVNSMDLFSKSLFLNSLNTQRLIVSNKLAIDVQYGMLKEIRKDYPDVVDGGVREGPFWVLAGALMPSVLIEIGYNSHVLESKRIQSKSYQKILARGIANGVDSFFSKND
ncbi:N-acetylmuramoyl-L-alanine amidase family protein [Helicobacter cetorum]|uniref:N-acetylmuramoyl-L-alanine amidase family protein n=1 Tax=Helicobacter cetorum TaxID=138563 RepID=UPI000CF09475|nr:N-acetylmuramoyl-L-alanine amidase [Helicobacter cetorum]